MRKQSYCRNVRCSHDEVYALILRFKPTPRSVSSYFHLLDELEKRAISSYLGIAETMFVSGCVTVVATKYFDRFEQNLAHRFFRAKSCSIPLMGPNRINR